MPESDIPDVEQAQFEALHYGTPLTIFPECKGMYAVLEVDDKYTPKLKLYSLATGKTGVMKIWKSIYNGKPVLPGDIFKLIAWETKPEYRYMPDKTRNATGRTELWIKRYEKVN